VCIDVTTIVDDSLINEELVIFARNQDILTTTERGVTTCTDTLTYLTGTPTFNLTHTQVRNIRSVTVDGDTMKGYRDYTPTYLSRTSSFVLTDTPTPSDSVVISYDYGSRDTIYSELSREILDRLTLPRVMVKVETTNTDEFSLGGGSNISDRLITFQIFATTIKRTNTGLKSIRQSVITNKKNFVYFPFITPITGHGSSTPISQEPEVFSKGLDCDARFVVERV